MEFKTFRRHFTNGNQTISWSPHWEIILEYERPDGKTEGEFGRPYFRNRHINPDVNFDWTPRISRNTIGRDEDPCGCHVSAASLPPLTKNEKNLDFFASHWKPEQIRGGELYTKSDSRTAHQRDWDFLQNTIEDTIKKNNFADGESNYKKIECLAQLCNEHRGKVYPSRHPVDFLLHSCFCVGAGNTIAALCHILGIPARTIHTATHTMAEAFLDGKWNFIDNIGTTEQTEWEKKYPDKKIRSIFREKNFIEVLLNPYYGKEPDVSSAQAERYTIRQWTLEPYLNTGSIFWFFNQGGAGFRRSDPFNSGSSLTALPCPENIRAIYPEWQEPITEAVPGRDNELILNPRQGWCKTLAYLDRQMGIRKRFFIGSLDGANQVKSLYCDLHLIEDIAPGFDPLRGGWELHLNNNSIRLDREDYTFRTGCLSFRLPIKFLKEKTTNELVLLSEKKYAGATSYRNPDSLPFWVYPDIFNIDKEWYAPGNKSVPDGHTYEGVSPIINAHSAWHLRPDAI